MTKKISLLLAILTLALGSFFWLAPVSAQFKNDSDLNIYFFRGEGCPHCEDEKKLLDQITTENPRIKVYDYEIFYNSQNAKLLYSISKTLGVPYRGVPYTIIGDKVFEGYSEYPTADDILEQVDKCLKRSCEDSVAEIVGVNKAEPKPIVEEKKPEGWPEKIKTPWNSEINTANISLPVLTIIMGTLDGFNPCAMWTLIFLISLLVNMGDKKRMWILGSTFIFVSGAVYFIFMSAWLNLLLFIGAVIWIRITIGLVALVAGIYNLKEYYENKAGVCKVSTNESHKKIFDRLKEVVYEKNFLLALAGIMILAFAVNLVEVICSAGFPAIYTRVLTLSNLPTWQYYFYILFYIFFYMLDDIIVFALSMWALKITGVTTKYSRWSNLIGGLILVILGIILILKPELLMFG